MNYDPFTWPALTVPKGHGTPEKPLTFLEVLKLAVACTAVTLSFGYFRPGTR